MIDLDTHRSRVTRRSPLPHLSRLLQKWRLRRTAAEESTLICNTPPPRSSKDSDSNSNDDFDFSASSSSAFAPANSDVWRKV